MQYVFVYRAFVLLTKSYNKSNELKKSGAFLGIRLFFIFNAKKSFGRKRN